MIAHADGGENEGGDEEKSEVVERLENLSDGDRAMQRTNPVAIDAAGAVVTADEIGENSKFLGVEPVRSGYVCPACQRLLTLRHRRGTWFFAHLSTGAKCGGMESPAHYCIKRGLGVIGWVPEHRSTEHGDYRYDVYDCANGVVAEVICSRHDRYAAKFKALTDAGVPVIGIFDSGSRSIASKFHTERIDLAAIRDENILRVTGLFNDRGREVMELIGYQRCYAFYCGLMWRAVAFDRWELLDAEHPLSVAATSVQGVKYLMIMAHQANASRVIELKRKGIDRKTWFDRKFRYRGEWTTTWHGDRDYIMEIVKKLISQYERAASVLALRKGDGGKSEPGTPKHGTAADALESMLKRHEISSSVLRDEAEQIRRAIDAAQLELEVVPTQVVITPASVTIPGRAEPVVVPVVEATSRVVDAVISNPTHASDLPRPATRPPSSNPVRDTPRGEPQLSTILKQSAPVYAVPVEITKAAVEGEMVTMLVRPMMALYPIYHGAFKNTLPTLAAATGTTVEAILEEPGVLNGKQAIADYRSLSSNYYGPTNWRPLTTTTETST